MTSPATTSPATTTSATAPAPRLGLPDLGFGVGLRSRHFESIWEHLGGDDLGAFNFLEVLSDNFMAFGGKPRAVLRRAAAEVPLVLHGVALSIGGPDPLDERYVTSLLDLIAEVRPRWFSDHLCFSSASGVHYHDLLPMPFTEEAVAHVASRAAALQDRADLPFLLENPSYYMAYGASELSEAEFLTAVVERADCGLLLDVNNVWVNATNHGYDPRAFIDALPLHRVVQIHLAGHRVEPTVVIDTHGDHVSDAVLDLYAYTIARTGPVATLLEWDHDVPPVEVLAADLAHIRAVGTAAASERAA